MYGVGKTISYFFAALCVCLITVDAPSAQAASPSKPVFFSLQASTNDSLIAREVIKDELSDIETRIGRRVTLGIAKEDLNDDGIKEFFIRFLDNDLFCDAQDCDTRVYALVNNDLTEIGRFKTRTIDVLNETLEGARSLMLKTTEGTQTKYVWDGEKYAQIQ